MQGGGETLAGAWAGGTQYGVNLVLLIKIVCLLLCVTWFPFVIFRFSHIWCLIILICVELKFIPHARVELISHKLVVVFCTVAVINIGCHEGKNRGKGWWQ
jgi:hypothetical protein